MDVRNTTKGIRGLHTVDGYRDLAPGELVSGIELTAGERASAESTGYFEFGKAAKSEPAPPVDPDALPTNVPKLKAIAKSEGVDLGEAKTLPDITAAIVAARAVRAAGGITPPAAPTDELDKMSDADLANTVAVLTGKPAPDGATRDDLLALARTPAA